MKVKGKGKGEEQGQSKGSAKADYQLNISTNVVQLNYRKYNHGSLLGAIHPSIHPRFLWAFHFVSTTNLFFSKVESKGGFICTWTTKNKRNINYTPFNLTFNSVKSWVNCGWVDNTTITRRIRFMTIQGTPPLSL